MKKKLSQKIKKASKYKPVLATPSLKSLLDNMTHVALDDGELTKKEVMFLKRKARKLKLDDAKIFANFE
jgi:hypothetical protein